MHRDRRDQDVAHDRRRRGVRYPAIAWQPGPLVPPEVFGHIDDAVFAEARNLPLPALSKGAKDGLPTDRQAPVITICARGQRSLYGLLLLKAQGYQIVKSVSGGMGAWVNAGLPTQVGH